ncbi:MAG: AMP-binding protein [Pseudomonadota bacterium]
MTKTPSPAGSHLSVAHASNSATRRWLAAYPPGVPADVDMTRYASLADIFDECFERYADACAYTCLGTHMSYREYEQSSRHLAAYLQSLGLRKGERVAVMLPNIPQSPVSVAAIVRAGFVLVNVNPLYTPRELTHQLADSGAKAIILSEISASTLQAALAETDVQHVIVTRIGDMLGRVKGAVTDAVLKHWRRATPRYELPTATSFKNALRIGEGREFIRAEISPDDLVALQYTGGSTGQSKGAMLTHANLVAAALASEAWINAELQLRPVETQLLTVCALPLYHVLAFVNCNLIMNLQGGRSILIPNARDMSSMVRAMRGERVHFLLGVDTLFKRLPCAPGFSSLDFSELRVSLGGGMAVKPETAETWKRTTGYPLAEGYGLTETTSGICCNRLDLEDYTGVLGVPLPSMEMRILSPLPRDQGDRDPSVDYNAELEAGREGEIAVRGPAVMRGYWQRPDHTQAVFTGDGFMRTGDIGEMDAQGNVRFVSRLKNIIVVNGFNVYPQEIEDAVSEEYPGRLSVAVGIANETSGESVCLFIEGAEPSQSLGDIRSVSAVRARCKERLTNYKLPRHIWFIDHMPQTAKTDVNHVALRRLAKNLVDRCVYDGELVSSSASVQDLRPVHKHR